MSKRGPIASPAPAFNRAPIGLMVSIGDREIHVREDGLQIGMTLVLLHGMLGSMRWFDKLVPLLSENFHLIRMDLLGHGYSSKLADKYSPEEQARAIATVLDRMGVSGATVVGHSLGSNVAISLAEQGADVSRIVIIDEAPDYSLANPSTANSILRTPGIGPFLYRNLPDFALRKALSIFFAPDFRLEAAFDVADRPILDARAVLYDCFRNTQIEKERFVADKPLDVRLRELNIPALILFGQLDQVFQCAGACRRYGTVPNAAVEVLANAGHSPMLEDPTSTAQFLYPFLNAR